MPRVLVVDDSVTSQAWSRGVLEREGWSVDVAATGRDAIAQARARRYDAIVLDFVLPDMDGLDVLRDIAVSGASAPCVVVSGAPSPRVAARLLGAGAVDFLPKEHLTPLRLAHAVRHALETGPPPVVRVRAPRSLPQEEDEPMRMTEPGTALVVEDTETTRLLLRRMLEKNGWTVVEAPDARRAVDAAIAATPDVVILDHVLPDGEGAELVSTFSAIGVPVIALTGHGDETVADRFMRAGAADYLAKETLTESHLLTALARVTWIGAGTAGGVRKRR